jgi:multidrug efflux pump subunit AcrA (membrane-fusion protein)
MKSTIAAGLLTTLLLASAFAQSDGGHSIRVSGAIQAAAQTDVKSEVEGRIKKLHVGPGHQVKAGDLLIEIENPLVENNSKLKVLAPSGGTVLGVYVIERQIVIPAGADNSTKLVTIANLSKLVVDTHLSQVDAAKLASKQAVQFTADAIPREPMEATISFIAPIATPKNSVKGFTVQAIIEKPDVRLRPGMTGQLTIPILAPASK